MDLTFSRSAGTITGPGQALPARNNVDSHSNGQWPLGTFAFSWYDKNAADGPNGAYGSYGILIFSVPGHTGMGIHSGRRDIPDGLGRVGIEHCTMGCIRTDDESMAVLAGAYNDGPIGFLTVVE